MNIRQLVFFCRAARSGNFSVAAREEGVSVQAVSKSIHELEEEIGGQLFVRSGRGMRLTPLGRTLLEPALKTVESFDSVEHAAASWREASPRTKRSISSSPRMSSGSREMLRSVSVAQSVPAAASR